MANELPAHIAAELNRLGVRETEVLTVSIPKIPREKVLLDENKEPPF